ncbi:MULTISPECIES: ribosome small subunit-dependent GTPase A [unclassified Janthinobacterium]|uniref:ribosome small subunit-dependent GTPase A n=1 Tax=unclassified Janthinobacterium TaxID=2610881 RepID=UPI00034AA115|nr:MULTISPECIES: ribosome small subunit-dependent GTPase A [unclassified Janthinobacterium]MEC5160853.1 ribosome biogenesis GTPase [Janthinobacterium sp. CG_S6]
MIDFDFELLRNIGLNQTIANRLYTLELAPPGARLARITEVQRDWLTVHDGREEYRVRALPRVLQALLLQNVVLVVGDWVLVEAHPNDEYWIVARLAPVSHIARRTNDSRRQSLASNIDTALLVMGLDHDFNLRRMERYIALVQAAGVAAVVVLTKADIGSDVAQRMAQLQQRLPASVPAFAVNALAPDTAAVLAPWLTPGQTLMLLGTSGAGKSTLTNTLCGGGQQTGGVRRGDGRGRHTTTSRSLHQCEGGACIIDTPGLRSWRPDANERALAATFEDIDALAAGCQFRDCGHADEPGCAVRGAVDADRLRNYHKLLREARRGQQTPLERIAERAKWKVLMKSVQQRDRHNRG